MTAAAMLSWPGYFAMSAERKGPKGRASLETLEELHRLLAADLLARLQDTKRRPSAALLNVARVFLNNNGINMASIASRREMADELDQMLAELPFDTETNVVQFDAVRDAAREPRDGVTK
jgi:hypothetical protein